jgi:hypothetical protein
MLQRIQTVYLVIAFIAISLLFSRLPIAEFTLINVGNIPLNVISSYQNPDLSQDVYTNVNVLPLIITIGILLILIIASIILYGNRPLQLKITMFAFLLNVVLIIVMFFTADNMQKQLNTQANYKFGVILPLISLVLIILASKAIRKDERLVKGSDRLR